MHVYIGLYNHYKTKTVLFKENVFNSNFGSHFFLTNYFSASESDRDLSLFNLYSVQCSWNKGSFTYYVSQPRGGL